MKRIKILHVTTDSRLGGAEHLLCWLARYLDRSCFEMVVCTLKPQGDLHDRLQGMGVITHDLGIKNVLQIFNARSQFLQILEEEKPDIVHTHLLYAGLFGHWLTRKLSVKLIHTRHYADFYSSPFHPLRYLDKVLMRCSPQVIAISQAVHAVLEKKLHVDQARIKRIDNGVDLDWILEEAQQEPDETVQRIVLKSAPPRIGLVGNFHPCKGHDLLIRAIPDILQVEPKAHFIFMGEGKGRRRIENQVEALGLSEQVYFAGFIAQIVVAMKQLDLLVIPSRSEGFGLVACEAMALGLPVIASSADGLCEIIEHEETGLIFENGQVKALTQAIIRILRDEVLRRRCIDNARKKVASHYDVRLMTKIIEETYLEVLGHP